MQRLEMRQMLVTYCDQCGAEVEGNSTTFRSGDGKEHHACHTWNEEAQARCDQLLERKLADEARAARATGAST